VGKKLAVFNISKDQGSIRLYEKGKCGGVSYDSYRRRVGPR